MEKAPHPLEKLSKGASVSEGKATILFPNGEVFYNPVQEFNRDLSISVIQTYIDNFAKASKKKRKNEGINILEALSATGLRSIRYAKEIKGINSVIANDLDPSAVELIKSNIKMNGEELNDIIIPHQGDANWAMHKFKNSEEFIDVIDLDPYGSAAPFIDSAVQCVNNGGLLCITCTDMAVLCAKNPETCFAKYGGTPCKGVVCHESALRLLLQAVETCANKYKKHIVPLMSCSIDFYIRVFIRIIESPANVKFSGTKRGIVERCTQCKTIYPKKFITQSSQNKNLFSNNSLEKNANCSVCSGSLAVCGPMWLGPLHDSKFVKDVISHAQKLDLGTFKRIEGFCSVISEEICDPLFFCLTEMSSFLKSSVAPLLVVRSALINAGYSVSGSHCDPCVIKSNAPSIFVWKILIEWFKKEFPGKDISQLGNIHETLLLNCEKHEKVCDFTVSKSANPLSRSQSLKRYQENPTKNWGPLSRAKQQKN